jgi:large subunit ribosomal protein L15
MGTTLNNLSAPDRSRHRKKRVGRGQSSGLGKTAGRGGKGQKARTGNMNFEGFEGGQMPLQRRLPKFGFKNIFRIDKRPVNLDTLEAHCEAGETVGPEDLFAKGVLSRRHDQVKILGTGTLTKKLTVRAHGFSAAAREAIEKAGGTAEVIVLHPPKASEPKA